MPIVPNAPGVPALTSYATLDLPLLASDALGALTSLLFPSWGIYIEGQPVITPASIATQTLAPAIGAISSIAALLGVPNVVPVIGSTVSFEYAGDSPISTYPQEKGAFQSYDKVVLPFDVRLKIACSGSDGQRQAFFSTLEALKNSTALVDIVTPESVYTSCNCKHVDYSRTSYRGATLIQADASFEEVREVSSSQFTTTQQPGDAGTQSIGTVQPQSAPDSVATQFNGIGGAPY
jgi:hypothetical protein